MKKIDKEEVKHIANLAKLEFTESELDLMQENLSNILTYMEVLENVDTKNVEINEIISTNLNISRKDEPVKFENVDKIIENAEVVDGMIVVPDLN